ncbi:MAG: flavodoxin-dependent (E)-4-hydroxy-3-methylbut-2-enyl-diphosphate synthase [Candidatus Hydrothermales bacterium]
MQGKFLKKRKSIEVKIGNLIIGGGNLPVIQSMTDTRTSDIESTVNQMIELVLSGSEMVRITVNDESAAASVPEIVKIFRERGYLNPVIGDFHFNGHILLKKYRKTAELLDKYRINPGTTLKEENFREMIKIAIDYDKPVRIGVNWGSVDKSLLTKNMEINSKRKKPYDFKRVILDTAVESAIVSAHKAMELGLKENKIVLSCKVSGINELIYVYKELARKVKFALHLGLTEAGSNLKGIVASSIGIGVLLLQGIGDTIRVSLTPSVGEKRKKEVEVAKEILQSLGIKTFKAEVSSCPGCGRTKSYYFREIAQNIASYLEEKSLKDERFKNLKVAVMGCVVNGPGESRFADIGLSLPGIGEKKAAIYVKGNFKRTVEIERAEEELKSEIEEYIKKI